MDAAAAPHMIPQPTTASRSFGSSFFMALDDDVNANRRTLIACSSCRSRKCKCDGNPDGCQACADVARACTYIPVSAEENQVARAKKRYPEKKSGVAKRSRVDRPAPFKPIKRHSAVPEVVEPLITKLSLRKISFPDERRSSVDSQSPSALGSTTESASSRRSESPATPAEEGQPGPIKIVDTTRDRPVPSSHYTHFAFSFETAPPANSFQSSLPQQAAPYPTPMSHLDSPSYFPLHYFEQVHAPIAPTPAPRWSSLPTPEAESMSPFFSSLPFELQAPLGLFMPPSPAIYTPATPLLHELARNEERRKMEHWLASVEGTEGTGQEHSARDESLAMFGSPVPPNDGLFGYGHSSALGGIHGLF